jgi:glutathione S-transferase
VIHPVSLIFELNQRNLLTPLFSCGSGTGCFAAMSHLISGKPKLRYLSAWFCPFAHRATIALEHHRERLDYEWIEALGWYQKESSSTAEDGGNSSATGKEWYYHWKADELKRVNPSALVPTLIPIVIDPISGNEVTDEAKAVWESLVTVDYIDMVSSATGSDTLVPYDDPYEVARCRIWSDKVNRDCCSPYYDVLVRQDPLERKEYFNKLLGGLSAFSRELQKTSGPTFLANAKLSNVDVALIPWAYRYYVFEHYCGSEFVIPKNDPTLNSYHTWYEYVMQLDCVQRTLPDKGRYLDHIQKYADGTARSKVANAVRRGVAAHELDDDKD